MDIHKALSTMSPFPLRFMGGHFVEGIVYSKSPMCLTCQRRVCAENLGQNASTVICENGNTIFPCIILGVPVVVFGVITELSRHKLDVGLRVKFAKRCVQSKCVLKWLDGFKTALEDIEKEALDMSVENLEAFHDVIPSISFVQRDVEALIYKSDGQTFDQKWDNTASEVKKIYKSMGILKERVNLMPLLTNPDWITQGGRKRSAIYKLIDMLQRSFRVIAHEKRVTLNLSGTSRNLLKIYQSFSSVPFVLIDNAIKYSMMDQTVDVVVNDVGEGAVDVSVQSYGPIVPEDMREKIFEKKVRYSPLGWEPQKGSGLGLYLARLVSQAHGFTVQYRSGPVTHKDEIKCATNEFYFKVSD